MIDKGHLESALHDTYVKADSDQAEQWVEMPSRLYPDHSWGGFWRTSSAAKQATQLELRNPKLETLF